VLIYNYGSSIYTTTIYNGILYIYLLIATREVLDRIGIYELGEER
jgi:hypothetical protein